MSRRAQPVGPTFTARDFAIVYGEHTISNATGVNYVGLNPIDWFVMLTDPGLNQLIDKETQKKLIDSGVVGYLWGGTIVLDKRIPQGVGLVTLLPRETLDKEIEDHIRKENDFKANALPSTITMFIGPDEGWKLMILGART